MNTAIWNEQLSKEEAAKRFGSKWWEGMTDKEILETQLFVRQLIMPFDLFVKTAESFFDTQLTTIAFQDPYNLQQMFLERVKGEGSYHVE